MAPLFPLAPRLEQCPVDEVRYHQPGDKDGSPLPCQEEPESLHGGDPGVVDQLVPLLRLEVDIEAAGEVADGLRQILVLVVVGAPAAHRGLSVVVDLLDDPTLTRAQLREQDVDDRHRIACRDNDGGLLGRRRRVLHEGPLYWFAVYVRMTPSRLTTPTYVSAASAPRRRR